MKHFVNNLVITGACGGLGQALATAALARGSRVALVGLNAQVLQKVSETAPYRCAIYTPDVSDAAAMSAMAQDWMTRFGVPDAVIANAGVAGGFDTAIASDLQVLRRMLEINLIGVATTFQPFLAPMRERGSGTLAGVASIAGWRGMPGNGAYCASKGGLIRYLQSLRAEMRGTGLTVCTISPGYLRTALTAGNRFAMPGLMEPQDAAEAILRGLERGREKMVLPRQVGWLSRALALLPDRWHDSLLRRQPRKPRPGEAGDTPIPGLSTHPHGSAQPDSVSPPPASPAVQESRH
ncbi:SDR family oxidoreductase [Variovorax dokdonensis]|uniref:SDR family oxidoreductase n=1 Tax=Variovorax dokdonensis TaxID=344883 RepID=A0ABT7NBF6_9BURK|nr:SDR family oxidoreductase [Variovorax dokdonensis]MDM0045272.1 SDR family oxidoreductase [Variovorax dokdonensis]